MQANKKPNPPAIIFLIDVSYNNIKSGLVKLICSQMKSIIAHLPADQGATKTAMKVGFITYNNSVHFYNIKNNLAVPQMMVVGDINEMFMPLLDGFLCDAEESASVIDILMEQIPTMFAETRETETILLPAIQAGLEALKASECTGKLLLFHSSLPVSEAPGKLKNRDDRNVLGTDKEKTVLQPQCMTYNNLGQDCVQNGCAVDLFIFNNSYIDLATIGQISRLTGGEIYKYTYFQADLDGERLIRDVKKNVGATCAFDAVMRVRTSTGIRPTDFYGHFFMSNTTDMEIAHIDRNKAVAVEIKHDDKLPADENVYIQVAVLYTSIGGQRRLRVLNLALNTCVQMSELFRCCDLDAVVLFLGKRIMFKLMESSPKAVKEELEQRCATILACYRKHCAAPTSAGQLILPECMKLLPLYVSCLLKNDAVSGGSDMTCDDRSYAMQFVLNMDLPTSVSYFYPRLIPIHDVDPSGTGIPAQVRTSIDKLTEDGAFILENGVHMFVWLGLALAPEFTQSVFGASCSQQIDTDSNRMPLFDNVLSQRVHQIIDDIQAERPHCMRVITFDIKV